jgi:hypothetical protein
MAPNTDGDRGETEGKQEKIEGVQCPAKKAGRECVALGWGQSAYLLE